MNSSVCFTPCAPQQSPSTRGLHEALLFTDEAVLRLVSHSLRLSVSTGVLVVSNKQMSGCSLGKSISKVFSLYSSMSICVLCF